MMPKLPARTFLDRSIVDLFARFGDWIVDGNEAAIHDADAHSEELVEHLNALRAIFAVNERANFQFITAEASVSQPIENKRGSFWATQLSEISDELLATDGPTRESRQKADNLFGTEGGLLADIVSIGLRYAVLTRCDSYMTANQDVASRAALLSRDADLWICTPSGYWQRLRPWAQLWR